GALLHQAPRQYQPPACRNRVAHRSQGLMDKPAGQRLSDRQRLNWLRLIRTENVGPAGFRELINRFGSADAALDALPELAARGGRRELRICTAARAEAELAAAEAAGARLVALGEPDYPGLMRRMPGPPPLLA